PYRILRLDELCGDATSRRGRVVYRTVGHAHVTLEGEIPAQEGGIGNGRTILEASEAGADYGQRIDLVGYAHARHDVVFLPVGIRPGKTVEQGIERRIARAGEAALALVREAVARYHHAVVDVAGVRDDRARPGIDGHGLLGIVEAGIENVVVAPKR